MKKEEKLNILSENASLLLDREKVTSEERNLTLSHIISVLLADNDDLSIEELIYEYKKSVPKLKGDEELLIYQQLSTSRAFASDMKKAYAIGSTLNAPAGSHEKIALVKNDFNVLAFEHFSRYINNAKQVFATSFSQACEYVNDGECEFCILPIENMSTGKMISFYSMIDKYELKICSVCDIDDDDGNTVRYALIGKGCFEPNEKSANTNFLFDFSIIHENGNFMSQLLSAAEACGATLLNFYSSPIEYDDRLNRYLLSFKIFGNQALAFRAFLTNSFNTYVAIGLYPEPF